MKIQDETIHDAVLADFRDKWQDAMSPEDLQTSLDMFKTDIPSRPASGSIKSALAIAWFTIDVEFTGEFKGWAAGGTVAEGPFTGNVYSNNFSLLASSTQHFYFWLALSYTSISFYDANSVNLGYFEGASLGVVGAGGGPGQFHTA